MGLWLYEPANALPIRKRPDKRPVAMSSGKRRYAICAPRRDHGSDSVAPRPRGMFGYLLRNPFRRRVRRDIDPHKVSPRQPNNDKGIEQLKSDGGHNE